MRTGLIAAGVALVFWPAAPFVLLHKGKEAEVARGSVYTVYTDTVHSINAPNAPAPLPTVAASFQPIPAPPAPPAAAPAVPSVPETNPAFATILIDADSRGAEIEIDRKFVGNTPSTLSVAPGVHMVTVRDGSMEWSREIDLQRGTSASVKARLVPATPQNALTGVNLK